jgi:hypothetical protein
MVNAILSDFDFVFLDGNSRPFYCYDWNGEKWLFYWLKDHWISLRKVTNADKFPLNLSDKEQEMYHKLHAEWELSQINVLKSEIQEVINAENGKY